MALNTPQGTRDFSPEILYKRNYILNIIQSKFKLNGYQPLETPAMENLDTLMGKYGDEGDKLIFKILNNGLHEPKKLEKVKAGFENILSGKNDTHITERALRYDLTIPFARYVVMNQGTIALPFKRYQMQPVWRADRPQKGRYREFWQCDADIVGSNALFNEAELLTVYAQVFDALQIPEITIHINNRKILAAIADLVGQADKMMDLTVAIDKLDKIGWEKVAEELFSKGFTEENVNLIQSIFNLTGDNEAILNQLQDILIQSDLGLKGINELREILKYYQALNDNDTQVKINLTLARGLNYYTGMITEVTTSAVKMGSIGGGGRYDDLTGVFGLKNVSGVGISFGVDRIYDVMEELNLFPQDINVGTQAIILVYNIEFESVALDYLKKLRAHNIPAEYYCNIGKMDKQMKYTHKRNIPFAIIIGEDEFQNHNVSVKDMRSGVQQKMTIDQFINSIS